MGEAQNACTLTERQASLKPYFYFLSSTIVGYMQDHDCGMIQVVKSRPLFGQLLHSHESSFTNSDAIGVIDQSHPQEVEQRFCPQDCDGCIQHYSSTELKTLTPSGHTIIRHYPAASGCKCPSSHFRLKRQAKPENVTVYEFEPMPRPEGRIFDETKYDANAEPQYATKHLGVSIRIYSGCFGLNRNTLNLQGGEECRFPFKYNGQVVNRLKVLVELFKKVHGYSKS